ncbi:uncharacterized protein [Argopecten irradians]|uniref:uncharacterized protein n=1 Tax=Argopecten irradians TaxID=31199 RepID=UPI00371FFB5A
MYIFYNVFFFIRLFLQSFGREINELPEVLLDKVTQIPELLESSRAVNTCKAYKRGFLRWKKWAINSGIKLEDTLPAKPLHVAIYLTSIIQTANSPSPLVNVFYSLKWFHDIFDFKSPTDSKLVVNILEAGKRKLARPVIKKEPVTIRMLSDMFDFLFMEGNSKNQRIICASLLGYAGFLRSEELLKIKRSDIVIDSTHMRVFIESSKTDKYRDGAWIVISRTGTKLCPVVNIERYFEWLGVDESDDVHLLCNLSALKELIKAFKPHVNDISKYCLHSLRSGGATAAANRGIGDRLFKRHGRRVSENARDADDFSRIRIGVHNTSDHEITIPSKTEIGTLQTVASVEHIAIQETRSDKPEVNETGTGNRVNDIGKEQPEVWNPSVDLYSSPLTSEHKQHVRQLLRENCKAFAWNGEDMGCVPDLQVDIKLNDT